MTDDLNLAAIRAALDAATPGPWSTDQDIIRCERGIPDHPGDYVGRTVPTREFDAELIVLLVNNAPALLAAAEASHAFRDKWEAALDMHELIRAEAVADAETRGAVAAIRDVASRILRADTMTVEAMGPDENWSAAVTVIAEALTRYATALETGAEELPEPQPPLTVEELIEWLHHRNAFDYDECEHGTYTGGPSDGEPYAMCERQGQALAAYLESRS